MKTMTFKQSLAGAREHSPFFPWSSWVDWWRRKPTLVAIELLDSRLRKDVGLGPLETSGGMDATSAVAPLPAWR